MILPQLIPATLIRRYKRFLADVRFEDDSETTVHCPNSGSMLGCDQPGSPVLVSDHPDANRRYRYTWELIKVGATWVGINTMVPNRLVGEAIAAGEIPQLTGYTAMRREAAYGVSSRIDWLLTGPAHRCYVEVKNVTLVQDGVARFPDAVTARGRKHLLELTSMVKAGQRAVQFFVVQRMDAQRFEPAADIDPQYAAALTLAHANGVEVLVYQAEVTPQAINLVRKLPWPH